jgi:hypothetical protein
MNSKFSVLLGWSCIVGMLFSNSGSGIAQEKSRDNRKNVCAAARPETSCGESNTCGSASTPCTVDVKRTAESASATASIGDPKANAPFCVKSGTRVVWQSLSKNTGFVIDLGASSPFDPAGTIIGGSDRSVTVVAKTPGCFKYSAGACVSGASYGMCDSVESEFIVVGATP